MKKEILMLVIGILIGAIISTGIFLVLRGDNQGQMDMKEPPTAMDGNNIDGGRMRDRANNQNTTEQQEINNSNETNS